MRVARRVGMGRRVGVGMGVRDVPLPPSIYPSMNGLCLALSVSTVFALPLLKSTGKGGKEAGEGGVCLLCARWRGVEADERASRDRDRDREREREGCDWE